MADQNVKFIRRNGHVIPIKGGKGGGLPKSGKGSRGGYDGKDMQSKNTPKEDRIPKRIQRDMNVTGSTAEDYKAAHKLAAKDSRNLKHDDMASRIFNGAIGAGVGGYLGIALGHSLAGRAALGGALGAAVGAHLLGNRKMINERGANQVQRHVRKLVALRKSSV